MFSDIVFFIFLYQRWIYKVDHKRVNEFGFSGEMEDDAKKQVAITDGSQQQPLASSTTTEPIKTEQEKKTD